MIRVRLEGERELNAVLSVDRLFGRDYRVGLVDLGQRLKRFMEDRSPRRTGHLRGGIEVEVDSRPVPRFVGVESTALGPAGFDYGALLDTSSRTHYRSGPLEGRPTRGWWSGGVSRAQRLIDDALERIGAAIERNFGGR